MVKFKRYALALATTLLVAVVVGCGSGDEAASIDGETASLQTCPNTEQNRKGSSPSASSWGGSVSGIDCLAAGKLITDDLMGGFTRAALADLNVNDQAAVQAGEPGTYEEAGFACTYGRHDGESGWPVRCERGDEVLTFNVTP